MATIDMRLHRLDQLFDSLDPAPFREKSLDRNAEAWLLDCVAELQGPAPLTIRVVGPESMAPHVLMAGDAIRARFALLAEQAMRRHRRRKRVYWRVLVVGLLVLAASLLLRSLLDANGNGLGQIVAEGLLILGWVALWRPVEVVLFEHWEQREQRRLLQRLAAAEVAFVAEPG